MVKILGVKARVEQAHLKELIKNMHEFFPFCASTPSPENVKAFFISRRQLKGLLVRQSGIERQLKELTKNGVQIKRFSIWKTDEPGRILSALQDNLVKLAKGRICRIPLMKDPSLVYKKEHS